MFSKNTEKLESFIGLNSHFKGNVIAKGTVRIDGKVEGNVEADWLILGEGSNLKGDISARGVVIGGKVDGNIKASEIIEMKPKGQVMGEITTKKLTVAEGAVFNGHSAMLKKESGESNAKSGVTSKAVI
ncbi:MAG: polymer-forming cytoskeletal protein [Nitrospiraceae bacterium]|nr:polymer-forming cytoskeletal protein [Nitrospiraceae bacterium]